MWGREITSLGSLEAVWIYITLSSNILWTETWTRASPCSNSPAGASAEVIHFQGETPSLAGGIKQVPFYRCRWYIQGVNSGRGPQIIFRCWRQRIETELLPFAKDFQVLPCLFCVLHTTTPQRTFTYQINPQQSNVPRKFILHKYTNCKPLRNNANTSGSQWQKSFHLWSDPSSY